MNQNNNSTAQTEKSDSPVSILAVDDDPQVRRLMVRILNSEKISVSCAENFEEALHLAEELSPSIILLDLHLSSPDGLDGFSCLRALRQNGYAAPIFIFSGDSSFEQAHRAATLGADGYLVKGSSPGFWDKLKQMTLGAFTGFGALGAYSKLPGTAASYLKSRNLSDKDLELLNQFYNGVTEEKQIASVLGRTSDSVLKQFQNIRDLMGAETQADLGRILGVLSCFSETY